MRTKLLTLLGALTGLTVGSTVLLGWMFDLPVLRSLVSGAAQMYANTAVGLLAISTALLLHSGARGREWPRLALALSLAVTALGAATLLQYVSRRDFGIDQLLFADTVHAHNTNPGRMSPFAAWGLLMLGIRLAAAGRRGWLWLRRLCAAQVTLIGVIAVLGYLCNASALVTNMWVSPMAVSTALVFIVMGAGLLAKDVRPTVRDAEESRAFSGVERKLVVAAWSMVLVLVVSSGYTYRTYMDFVRAEHLMTHTYEVRLELARLGGCLDHLEAAQRPDMLLGDRSNKAQYKAGLASCGDAVRTIRALASDNDAQTFRALKLQGLVFERLQALKEMTDIYGFEFHGVQATPTKLADPHGPRLMRDIERVVMEMDGVERNLLAILEKGQEEGRAAVLVSLSLTLAITVAIFAGLICAIRTTLRKSAAARARRKQQRALLSALINSIPDVIAYRNRDGQYLGCNRAYAEMLGKTPDEVIGRTPYELFSPDHADNIRAQDQLALGGVETSAEEWVTYHGGRRELLHVKRNLLRDQDGRVTGMLAIGREITERKRAEEEVRQAKELAEGATRMKSDFLANMSHEIRTPMTGVLGMVDVLAAEELTPVQKGYVEGIRKSGRHLLNVINDILDFSKLETGKLELERIDFSVPELLNRLQSLTQPLAAERGLDLHFQLATDVPAVVRGDPRRLTQVLLNLVTNAIKFTDHGSVTVAVRVSQAPHGDAGTRLHFEVCDTGIGIAAKTLAQLFAPFVQADSSTGRRYGGSGLGLAICKRLVEAMSGTIGATSEAGSGSRFFFEVPLERGDPQGTLPHGTTSAAPPEPRRILIAEDFEMNRDILQAALSRQGHELVFATNGSEAVDRVRQQVFDLVLMDVQMPVMDGVEATRHIRNLDGPARDVPIIGLTANVMARDRARYLEAGMNGCLMKPIDWDELSAAIGRIGTVPKPACALVDAQVLAALGRIVGEDQMQSLVRQGIETYRDYCTSMGSAAEHSDLSNWAHKLKGSAGTLGFRGISAAATRIESAIANGLDGAPLVRELERAIESTLQELVKLGIVGDDSGPSAPRPAA